MDKVQLQKAVAEVSRTAGNASNNRSAYAEVVMDIVQPNHLSLDLARAFMDVITMNPGDQIGRRVRRGRYPVRTMVPGSKHLHDVLSYVEQSTFSFDRLIAGTSHNLWEIQSGEVGTVEQMRNELRADLFDELVSKVFGLLSTVWNGTDTPNNFIDVSGTGITETALDTMIETVLDHSGTVRAIVGSRKALLPVYRFAQYREFMLGGTGNNPDRAMFPVAGAFDEFTRTGRVATYAGGIPLVELPQIYRNRLPAGATGTLGNNAAQRMIPTDRVLVIGDNVGSIALMGGTEYQDYTDPTTQPPNYVLHCWQAYGMLLDNVEGIGVLRTNT